MIPSDIFDNMPKQFNTEKAGDLNATIGFNLSGDNGGEWHVIIADGELVVHDGSTESTDAVINMDGDDYVAMTTGQANPVTLFMTGKVKVQGDLGVVMKMQSLFDE